jgi:hypothetical protein
MEVKELHGKPGDTSDFRMLAVNSGNRPAHQQPGREEVTFKKVACSL